MAENDIRNSAAIRIGALEADVLTAADAIAGFAAMDFSIIDDQLADGMTHVFLHGMESTLSGIAEELNRIFHELCDQHSD